jgi:hypothetical protein
MWNHATQGGEPASAVLGRHDVEQELHYLGARAFVPLHFEGWSHLRESREQLRAVFERRGIADWVVWLEPGRTTSLEHV